MGNASSAICSPPGERRQDKCGHDYGYPAAHVSTPDAVHDPMVEARACVRTLWPAGGVSGTRARCTITLANETPSSIAFGNLVAATLAMDRLVVVVPDGTNVCQYAQQLIMMADEVVMNADMVTLTHNATAQMAERSLSLRNRRRVPATDAVAAAAALAQNTGVSAGRVAVEAWCRAAGVVLT